MRRYDLSSRFSLSGSRPSLINRNWMMILSTTSRPPRFEQYLTQKCVHHSCYVYRGCTGDVGVGRPARCRSGWAFAAKVPGLLGSLQECPTSLNLGTFRVLQGLAISDVFVPLLPCLDVLVLAPDYFFKRKRDSLPPITVQGSYFQRFLST